MQEVHQQLLQAVQEYKVPQAAIDLLQAHRPLVLAGVSGSGKHAVEERIQQSSKWRRIVTHTTRPPRDGEQNGQDYWFASQEEMLKLITQQEFIEVKQIHTHFIYGSSLRAYNQVLQEGNKPLMIIDVQGIETISKQGVGIRPFFVLPPSFDTWMERLDHRGHMSHTEKVHRLRSARLELEVAIKNEKFILVVNDELSRVSGEIIQGFTDIPTQRKHRELAENLIEHIKAY